VIQTATQSITITGMSGGSTGAFNSGPQAWYHPGGQGGDANVQLSASNSTVGSIDAAYVLSSTSGSTTVTFTLSASATSPKAWIYEVSYSNGPVQIEVPFAFSQTGGVAPTIMGANDFIIQAINPSSAVTSINQGYTISGDTAYLANSTNGNSPTWSAAPSSAVVNVAAFMEFDNPPGLGPQWIVFQRAGSGNSDLACFNASNIRVGRNLGLLIASQQATQTCASIDLSPAAYSYTSGYVAMRSFNFSGSGTIEFYGKFGGGGSTGMWPAVWLYDSSCQPSDPTGTDNNCNAAVVGGDNEIDMTEILGTPTSINQEIHVAGGHNDGCTATVTDATQNFHDYKLVWVSGTSLTWYVDGAQTCSIVESYVPAGSLYVKIDMYMGQVAGTINNSSLPWTTQINWLTVTQSGSVIFSDYFPLGGSVRSGAFSGATN
jgi:hypothetical protein